MFGKWYFQVLLFHQPGELTLSALLHENDEGQEWPSRGVQHARYLHTDLLDRDDKRDLDSIATACLLRNKLILSKCWGKLGTLFKRKQDLEAAKSHNREKVTSGVLAIWRDKAERRVQQKHNLKRAEEYAATRASAKAFAKMKAIASERQKSTALEKLASDFRECRLTTGFLFVYCFLDGFVTHFFSFSL